MQYKAPFPYFGGKMNIADAVWKRLGADVTNYVEPFFGSGAVLLNRPNWSNDCGYTETVNDMSGFVANFWRAVRSDPECVAYHADWPVNENDLHARHAWLVNQESDLRANLEGDPEWFDAKVAGWWVWGVSCWIGSGWCSGNGPWQRAETDDGWQLVDARKLVHLGDKGQGSAGTGSSGLYAWMEALGERLSQVRVCCGDWSRVTGPTPTVKMGMTGVFLDPPYTADAKRSSNVYEQDSLTVGHDVAAWCKENQDNPLMRIALCGYDGEYDFPGWECLAWKASNGYQSDNGHNERIWFSPNCLRPVELSQLSMFD